VQSVVKAVRPFGALNIYRDDNPGVALGWYGDVPLALPVSFTLCKRLLC
jgi:hypothetical protein